MLYVDADTGQFIDTVRKNDNKIILYGFGVIGKITAPLFLKKNGLSDRFCFFIDADDINFVVERATLLTKKPVVYFHEHTMCLNGIGSFMLLSLKAQRSTENTYN